MLYGYLNHVNAWLGIVTLGFVLYKGIVYWNTTHVVPAWFFKMTITSSWIATFVITLEAIQDQFLNLRSGPASIVTFLYFVFVFTGSCYLKDRKPGKAATHV
jgi:hypothetical protein